MPRRKGIFRRVAGRILHPFGGRRKPAPPEPEPLFPPPAPPPPVVPPEVTAGARHELRMQEIFTDITGSLQDYPEWREVYDPLSIVFQVHRRDGSVDWIESYPEIEEYWDEFLRAYYLTTHEPGFVTREKFSNDTGIPGSEVDWDLWREIRRGTP